MDSRANCVVSRKSLASTQAIRGALIDKSECLHGSMACAHDSGRATFKTSSETNGGAAYGKLAKAKRARKLNPPDTFPEIPSWFDRRALGLSSPTPEERKGRAELEALEHFHCAVENYNTLKVNETTRTRESTALRLMNSHAKEVVGFRLERKEKEEREKRRTEKRAESRRTD